MPTTMVRVWLQEPDGPQPVVLFDPAHPALQVLAAARAQGHSDPREAARGVATALEDAGLPEASARTWCWPRISGTGFCGTFATTAPK